MVGESNTADNRTIRFVDAKGTALEEQTVSGQVYPFCSMPVSHSTVPLDQGSWSTSRWRTWGPGT